MMPRPSIYYNDNCPQVCAWIRQLMFDGLIPYGVVDSRSILDVQPADLEGALFIKAFDTTVNKWQ